MVVTHFQSATSYFLAWTTVRAYKSILFAAVNVSFLSHLHLVQMPAWVATQYMLNKWFNALPQFKILQCSTSHMASTSQLLPLFIRSFQPQTIVSHNITIPGMINYLQFSRQVTFLCHWLCTCSFFPLESSSLPEKLLLLPLRFLEQLLQFFPLFLLPPTKFSINSVIL